MKFKLINDFEIYIMHITDINNSILINKEIFERFSNKDELSEEEFFELSVREAKTIVELHKQEFTNGILRAYIQVIKSQI